jgi:hypothetical protein
MDNEAIRKARHALEHVNEEGLRSILERSIDTYYWNEDQIVERLRYTGDKLLEETALHIAGLIAGIDVDPDGSAQGGNK